jgi:hypothetical protein
LLERASGVRLPGALVPVAGLALIIVVGQLTTATDPTAEATTPLVVALAVAGWAVAIPARSLRPEPWMLAAAAGVFVAFGAPVLLSGEPTFTGYIKLDDTATWLALTDHVMEHGRDADALPPSSHEATVEINLGNGYPIGAFVPLGVGSATAGEDPAWTLQPYLSVLAATLALGLSAVAAPLVPSTRMRAIVVFVAAQPALLFGYTLWGGVKELVAAALLPLVAVLATSIPAARSAPARARFEQPEATLARSRVRRGPVSGDSKVGAIRALIPVAVASAAVVAVLSVGGAAWLVPLIVPAAAVLGHVVGAHRAVRWVAAFGAVALALIVPALALGGAVPPWARPLTNEGSLGNLHGPLSTLQLAGVWPSGDFRLDPDVEPLTGALIAVVIGSAIGAVALALRERAWALVAYVGGTIVGCAAILAVGSPWVDAKALAIASPAVLVAATSFPAAYSALARSRLEQPVLTRARSRVRRGWVCGGLFVVIAVGVLWSNALAYREVTLAPRMQLAELETIGDRIARDGPTLMTEYQPYGARHFLRDAAAEGVSELRRRRIPLRDGSIVRTGRYADTDELDPGAVLAYRTLVLRRSPVHSRPPAPYRPVFRGEYYEVWQRSGPTAGVVLAHRGLGSGTEPTAVPRCAAVRALARRAGPGARLAAARRPAARVVPLAGAERPSGWGTAGDGRNRVLPRGSGTIATPISVPAGDRYRVWIGGSVRSRVEVDIDGRTVGAARHELNNSGQYIPLGTTRLSRGTHEVAIRLAAADWRPGSGGQPLAIGPMAIGRAEAPGAEIASVAPRHARRLCGRRWDWIEALGS